MLPACFCCVRCSTFADDEERKLSCILNGCNIELSMLKCKLLRGLQNNLRDYFPHPILQGVSLAKIPARDV